MSVIVGCPADMLFDFRRFVADTKFFGKYKVFSAVVYDHNTYTITAPNKHLETMAEHPLIQYIKNANHPANDDLLHHQLTNAAGPQEVYEYFLTNLKDEAIDENSKELSDDWRSPPTSANFDPWTYEKDLDLNAPPTGLSTYFGSDISF